MPTIGKHQIAAVLLTGVLALPSRGPRAADIPAMSAWAPPTRGSRIDTARALPPVSREEIFQAIQDDLARRGVVGREALRPGDLIIQSAVPALKKDAGLRARSIRYDRIRRETVFQLWASREPEYLPFDVTTRLTPESWGWASLAEGQPSGAGAAAAGGAGHPAKTRPPVLVKPGTPATLTIQGENVRVTTTVDPLQPGIQGQRILVREVASGQLMNAEVVDAGMLEASL
jgi:hypothetical protein